MERAQPPGPGTPDGAAPQDGLSSRPRRNREPVMTLTASELADRAEIADLVRGRTHPGAYCRVASGALCGEEVLPWRASNRHPQLTIAARVRRRLWM